MLKTGRPLSLLAAGAVCACGLAQGQAPYRIIDMRALRPSTVSRVGFVAGSVSSSHVTHAVLVGFKDGEITMTTLPIPPGADGASADGVNKDGDVVGLAWSGAASQVFLWPHAGGVHELQGLGGSYARAFGMNDSGMVVGLAMPRGDAAFHLVVWGADGAIFDITPPRYTGGDVRGVNNSGLAVGSIAIGESPMRPYVWSRQQGYRFLPMPAGFDSGGAMAINDSGYVVGHVQRSHDKRSRAVAVMWAPNGGVTVIGSGDGMDAMPVAINKNGVVVGNFSLAAVDSGTSGWVWTAASGMVALSNLIPKDSGWTLDLATSIDDAGVITGLGTFKNRDSEGYMLVPNRPSAPLSVTVKGKSD